MTNLRDVRTRQRVVARIERVGSGNFGDVALVGEGVSEARIHYGPGLRVYFVQQGSAIVVLLCGGDKGSQQRDIATAKALARRVNEKELSTWN